MKRSGSVGLTLIELMVTLAMLIVLLSLAVPSFARMMATNRMATQTNEFTAALNLARMEAVRRSQSIAIRSDGGLQTFHGGWKLFTDADSNGAQPGTITATDGTVIRESGGALGGNTTITRVTRGGTAPNFTYSESTSAGDRMYVVFNSRGANNATAAAFFRICDSNDNGVGGRIVQVSTVGKVSVDSNTAACP